MKYTVEQHAVLIGLAGKVLVEQYNEYGKDLFVNSIVKYAKQRGRRMRMRAIRDGMLINFETFQAYSELQLDTLPGDYSIACESPVYINCCHRCLWHEGWKKYGLEQYGEWYCRYIDLNLVQGFSEDMVMIARTMLGAGDDCCTFVSVGYEQTEASKKRIAELKDHLNSRYKKDFLYHQGHYLNSIRMILTSAAAVDASFVLERLKKLFVCIYGEELADHVWLKSMDDFDEL